MEVVNKCPLIKTKSLTIFRIYYWRSLFISRQRRLCFQLFL